MPALLSSWGTSELPVHVPRVLLAGGCCPDRKGRSSPVGCSAPWTGSSKPVWDSVLPLASLSHQYHAGLELTSGLGRRFSLAGERSHWAKGSFRAPKPADSTSLMTRAVTPRGREHAGLTGAFFPPKIHVPASLAGSAGMPCPCGRLGTLLTHMSTQWQSVTRICTGQRGRSPSGSTEYQGTAPGM